MKSALLVLAFLALCLIALPGCSDEAITPPSITTPQSEITSGVSTGTTISVSATTFTWAPVQDVSSFEYRLDAATPDVPWTSTTLHTQTFDYLDEGSHTFELRGVKGLYTEHTPKRRTFAVDAVHGPTAMFYPRHRTGVHAGDSFTYGIKAEDVAGLYGAKLVFKNNSLAKLAIDSVTFDNAALGSGGAFTFDSLNTFDHSSGVCTVNLVLRNAPGYSTSSSSPNTVIIHVYCRSLQSGDAVIVFDEAKCFFRNSSNQPIPIAAGSMVGGLVTAQ